MDWDVLMAVTDKNHLFVPRPGTFGFRALPGAFFLLHSNPPFVELPASHEARPATPVTESGTIGRGMSSPQAGHIGPLHSLGRIISRNSAGPKRGLLLTVVSILVLCLSVGGM